MRRGILVPLDGSANALRALGRALAMARGRAVLHPINVEPRLKRAHLSSVPVTLVK